MRGGIHRLSLWCVHFLIRLAVSAVLLFEPSRAGAPRGASRGKWATPTLTGRRFIQKPRTKTTRYRPKQRPTGPVTDNRPQQVTRSSAFDVGAPRRNSDTGPRPRGPRPADFPKERASASLRSDRVSVHRRRRGLPGDARRRSAENSRENADEGHGRVPACSTFRGVRVPLLPPSRARRPVCPRCFEEPSGHRRRARRVPACAVPARFGGWDRAPPARSINHRHCVISERLSLSYSINTCEILRHHLWLRVALNTIKHTLGVGCCVIPLNFCSVMILPQVHLRKPCYDFYFL